MGKINLLIAITRIIISMYAECLTTDLRRISGLKGGSDRRWRKLYNGKPYNFCPVSMDLGRLNQEGRGERDE
jgi:hypothetical protein